jgi:hypothetical protein
MTWPECERRTVVVARGWDLEGKLKKEPVEDWELFGNIRGIN